MSNIYLVTINEPHDHGSLGKCSSVAAVTARTEDEAISLAAKDEMFVHVSKEDWNKIVPECYLIGENRSVQTGMVLLRFHLMAGKTGKALTDSWVKTLTKTLLKGAPATHNRPALL